MAMITVMTEAKAGSRKMVTKMVATTTMIFPPTLARLPTPDTAAMAKRTTAAATKTVATTKTTTTTTMTMIRTARATGAGGG